MNQLMVPERWWPGGMFPNVLSSQDTYSELLTGTHKAQDTRWRGGGAGGVGTLLISPTQPHLT